MKLVALSDVHLGFRAFAATFGGRNAREVDVERAWFRAVENAVLEAPDLVTIAGDIFHNPRPSMHAVRAWRDGVRQLVRETDAEVIAILGNHDAGRTAETLSPVYIPDDIERFRVVGSPERIHVTIPRTGETVAVACFPFVARGTGESYRLTPDAAADVNVLLIHAAVRGDPAGDSVPLFYAGPEAIDVGREAEKWDVIAAGDFHEHRRLHPERLAFYSGSIERTSSNIWPETDPKGIVVCDTETGSLEFVVHETRPVIDIPAERTGRGEVEPSAAEVNRSLQTWVNLPGIFTDAVVRYRVDDFPREERDQVDWSLVRELKHRCLHFELSLKWASRSGATRSSQHVPPDGTGSPLSTAAREFFADDPAPVRACALGYLGAEDERAGEEAAA